MTRSSARFRTVLLAALIVLGLGSAVGCQFRQFRQPYHEPAVRPPSLR